MYKPLDITKTHYYITLMPVMESVNEGLNQLKARAENRLKD